jgi:AcrR family transcriptional regulator
MLAPFLTAIIARAVPEDPPRILGDSPQRLVHPYGLAGLSLRDLARRAGITTPTVYAYFDSKNAIFDYHSPQNARIGK